MDRIARGFFKAEINRSTPRDRPVDHPARDGQCISRLKDPRILLLEFHPKLPLQNDKEFIGIRVVMPLVRSFVDGQAKTAVVDFVDDEVPMPIPDRITERF